jgi:hypothetical protein
VSRPGSSFKARRGERAVAFLDLDAEQEEAMGSQMRI